MTYDVAFPSTLRGRIVLPTSKSLSARALIIAALAGDASVTGLSDCDDTRVLRHALSCRPDTVDVQAAGTAMRFATAYFATQPGEHTVTGTPRMCQRPIRPLVDALRALGAAVRYEGEEGFPPLRIAGRRLEGGHVALPADVSSQYVSALLMVAPALEQGLELELQGEVASRPYIDMTLGLMRHFGARAEWTGSNALRVAPGGYRRGVRYAVEPDWSAASYWYEMVALSDDAAACIELPGLRRNSLQGDAVVAELFRPLGVTTEYGRDGVRLCKGPATPGAVAADLAGCPDLGQTLVATCALLGRPFRFGGLRSLRIKETDRIAALQTELGRMGCSPATDGESLWSTATGAAPHRPDGALATYDDHRMAMALAPAALRLGPVAIDHPEVVSKSYPAFWDDLRRVGVRVAPGPVAAAPSSLKA